MKTYSLCGPYARQVTKWKLKFWFVLVHDDGSRPHGRYELSIDTYTRKMKARSRPTYEGSVPTHSSNLIEYAIPDDLSGLPSMAYPRFKGDTIAAALTTLLTPADVPDVVRVRLIGVLPSTKIPMKGD